MEGAGLSLEAHAEAGKEDGGPMVACEMEAAEALAGLAWCSASRGGAVTSGELKRQTVTDFQEKDNITASQHFNDSISTMVTSPGKIDKIVENIHRELHGRNKSRPKLTEGEKQARKLRRILANREAARQTIRRRQAMFLDLNRKVADVLEDNENLKKIIVLFWIFEKYSWKKKEKELAVEEYNSLKDRNEFLKAQLSKSKKAEIRDHMQEDPEVSCARKSGSAIFSSCYNPPSLVPCFWPPIFPLTDTLEFQCGPRSHNTNSSLSPMLLYPVPWLLPFFGHGSTPYCHLGAKGHQCSKCSCSETLLHEYNRHLANNRNTLGSVRGPELGFPLESGDNDTAQHPDGAVYVPGLFARVKPQETCGPARDDVGFGLSGRNQQSMIKRINKTEDVFAATEARRRRKEMMKFKNVPSRHHVIRASELSC
ncbi:hypothetical protein OROMI_012248 [Orobanche minor]